MAPLRKLIAIVRTRPLRGALSVISRLRALPVVELRVGRHEAYTVLSREGVWSVTSDTGWSVEGTDGVIGQIIRRFEP